MASCPKCGQRVIAGKYGKGTILLDEQARCFAAVADGRITAEDGDKLFMSLALVEHSAVCEKRIQSKGRTKEHAA